LRICFYQSIHEGFYKVPQSKAEINLISLNVAYPDFYLCELLCDPLCVLRGLNFFLTFNLINRIIQLAGFLLHSSSPSPATATATATANAPANAPATATATATATTLP
jgi:hypothetical protein